MKRRASHVGLIYLSVVVIAAFPWLAHAGWWCGPQGSSMSDWIPDKPTIGILRKSNIDLRGACMRHDVCYTSRGARKHDCDGAFLAEMTDRCNAQYHHDGRGRAACLGVAQAYYRAVDSGFGTAAFAPAQARHREQGAVKAGGSEVSAEISARRPWSPTGIYVSVGSSFAIDAQGRAAIDTDGAFATPEGSGRGIADNSALLAGAPLHSLVCRIGSGAPFFVGRSFRGKASAGGELACGMNEQPAAQSSYRDNSGTWGIRVSR